ncbi:hypothetical protein O6H91_17G031100 [Diphasiastrum complanatum]|uniref:Uncharacterized protein n=1 Tax=Diphasiastrum complanatum TaxID=34168 RepID=A0ACC2B5G9_DIPCM|nr:hypothetical protein O6H91_17G031100 [Diphasiastrum complanatum]
MLPSYKVVVAVGKDKKSKGAVRWCLQTLVKKGDTLPLLHVRPPVRSIPTPMGRFPVSKVDKEIVAAYIREVNNKSNKLLGQLKKECESHEVQPKIIIIENSSVKKGLVEAISELGICKLVIGSSAPSHISRLKVRKGGGACAYVSKHGAKFCAILAIRNGRLHSVKDADIPSDFASTTPLAHAAAPTTAAAIANPYAIPPLSMGRSPFSSSSSSYTPSFHCEGKIMGNYSASRPHSTLSSAMSSFRSYRRWTCTHQLPVARFRKHASGSKTQSIRDSKPSGLATSDASSSRRASFPETSPEILEGFLSRNLKRPQDWHMEILQNVDRSGSVESICSSSVTNWNLAFARSNESVPRSEDHNSVRIHHSISDTSSESAFVKGLTTCPKLPSAKENQTSEEIKRLKNELNLTFTAAQKAQRHGKISAILSRKRAEISSLRATRKAETIYAPTTAEEKMRVMIQNAAETCRKLALEEVDLKDEELADLVLAKHKAEFQAATMRTKGKAAKAAYKPKKMGEKLIHALHHA